MKRPEIENLKAGIYLQNLTIHQHADAVNELQNIVKYTGQIELENKELTESIESLLVLIDSRLSLFDSETIGKERGEGLIWKKAVKEAQDLIN